MWSPRASSAREARPRSAAASNDAAGKAGSTAEIISAIRRTVAAPKNDLSVAATSATPEERQRDPAERAEHDVGE